MKLGKPSPRSRSAEKAESRLSDAFKLKSGLVSAKELQAKNSAFPVGYFKGAQVDYAKMVGR